MGLGKVWRGGQGDKHKGVHRASVSLEVYSECQLGVIAFVLKASNF